MDFLSLITPDGIAPWVALAVILSAFATSALTAAFSIGGGLALIAIMSAILPAPAVVPVHGVAQIGSNASRAVLQRQHIIWPIVLWFSLGAVIGAALGGRIAIALPVWGLRLGVALFILFTIWGPGLKSFSPGARSYAATGAVSSFLTMFFGATGPIVATMIAAAKLNRMAHVGTHAVAMVVQHGLKIIIFGFLGFAYSEWAALIGLILVATFLGSLVGTNILKRMSDRFFREGFRWLLTAIAIYLVIAALLDLRTG